MDCEFFASSFNTNPQRSKENASKILTIDWTFSLDDAIAIWVPISIIGCVSFFLLAQIDMPWQVATGGYLAVCTNDPVFWTSDVDQILIRSTTSASYQINS